ncbi:MAG TPA: alpha-glucosidase [Terracidiphilus sp.]|nr:alpha-glucosidase [Terracidiphilus sp.]
MHRTRNILACAAAALLAAAALAAGAQTSKQQSAASEKHWWKNAVIYEIYPRSFQDSNGDGIGDLNGITARLDYLQKLGVDAIWLTPIYPSPQVDFGYDISDYENIDPQYGTLADFDHLIAEANKHHIRVLMDMVMNHSSDKHKWFMESRSSRTNPYRDWYVWHDGKGETATSPGEVPNNWQSDFGHSAWKWDGTTRQYYYHKFYAEQPDLNWNNPKVHQAFKDIISFWLKRGVAGFRFDAITTLFEDPNFIDDAVLKDKDGKPYTNELGDIAIDDARTNNLPQVHDVMAEMRAHADKFDSMKFPGTRVFIGETYLPNIAELAKQYGTAQKPEFHLPMDTQILGINKMDAAIFRQKIDDVESGIGDNTPLLVFDNHDNPRLDARYGDGAHDADIQRVLSTVLFATRGASLFYYGDEIGMKTTPPERKEDVKDPVGLLGWPKYKGRDGERTPMQWDATANSGFSKAANPWLPVPSTYTTVNAQAEESDPASLFTWFQTLISLKKTVPALARGEQAILDSQNPKVLSWVRRVSGSPAVIVSVNFSADQQTVSLATPGSQSRVKTLLKTPGATDPATNGSIALGPFGVYIGELVQ